MLARKNVANTFSLLLYYMLDGKSSELVRITTIQLTRCARLQVGK